MDLKSIFSKQKSKEVGIATLKGSIPAAIATAILSGVSTYIGIDLSVDAIVAVFFGAGIGSVVGQFQKNPAEAIRRVKGMFSKK